jgi:hypothetical protein
MARMPPPGCGARPTQAVFAAGDADASAPDLKPDDPVLRIAKTRYGRFNLVVESRWARCGPATLSRRSWSAGPIG